MKGIKKKLIKIFSSLAVSGLVVFFLMKSISFSDISEVLNAARIDLLLIALALYLLMVILRAARFQIFFRKEISFRQLVSIASFHNFFNEFLPFRSGELVYVYLIRKARIVGSRNLSSLLIVRVMDFLTVIIFALVALWLLLQTEAKFVDLEKFAWILPLVLGVGLVLFLLFIYFFDKVTSYVLRLLSGFKFFKEKTPWIEQKIKEFSTEIKNVWTKKFIVEILVKSFLLWLIVVSSYYLVLRALGVDISFLSMFFIIALPALVTVFPVQGAANVGTFEATFALGLITVGVGTEIAIVSSFAMHVVLWIFAAVSGLMGLSLKMFGKQKTPSVDTESF